MDGVTVNGDIVQLDTSNTIRQGLSNNGTWSLTSVSGVALLDFIGDQLLDGKGEIAMDQMVAVESKEMAAN